MSSCLVNTAQLTTNANRQLLIAFVRQRLIMWTNKYQPTIGDWYLAKVDGKKQILMWNDHNKFFSDFCGKTYKFDQIDCWLDDSKASVNVA